MRIFGFVGVNCVLCVHMEWMDGVERHIGQDASSYRYDYIHQVASKTELNIQMWWVLCLLGKKSSILFTQKVMYVFGECI